MTLGGTERDRSRQARLARFTTGRFVSSGERSNQVHITVDHDRCFGYARCVDVAPDTFSLDENGLSVPRESSDDEQTIRAAAWACPVQAIETDGTAH